MIGRAFTFIWARYCELRAQSALEAYLNAPIEFSDSFPRPSAVKRFERRRADAWQRHETWDARARKYFSKLGVDR